MQPVRVAFRQIGVPNHAADVYSPEEVEQDLAFKYADYDLFNTHYMGEVKDKQGNVVGYKVMFIFVQSQISYAPAGVVSGLEGLNATNVPAKRGRPPKSNHA